MASEFADQRPFIAKREEVRHHHMLPYMHKIWLAGWAWPLARLTSLSFDPVLKRISEQRRELRLGANSFCAHSSALHHSEYRVYFYCVTCLWPALLYISVHIGPLRPTLRGGWLASLLLGES